MQYAKKIAVRWQRRKLAFFRHSEFFGKSTKKNIPKNYGILEILVDCFGKKVIGNCDISKLDRW